MQEGDRLMWDLLNRTWDTFYPNVLAPNAWALASIGGHFVLSQRAHRRRHEELKAHITASITGRDGGESP